MSPRANSRASAARWTVLILASVVLWSTHEAGAGPLVIRIGAIGMTVGDMDRSVAFYADVLGFERCRTSR